MFKAQLISDLADTEVGGGKFFLDQFNQLMVQVLLHIFCAAIVFVAAEMIYNGFQHKF
ncbi:hypothetical protein LX99_02892 [Mucilaginibacter oryzae]|uniref:Uncharacterized protein n=1 Tax=Mucilaginibacter oryzae TaxID=468058 RepID=A0A316HQA7_9SPHI|nr:hypothetical protein LX99_02892 [Mucilaginibacter oryzae]